MDGHNDVSALTAAGPHYDPYSHTPHLDEFNELANPQSFASLGAGGAAWLRNNSIIFRIMEEHFQLRLTGMRRQTTARKQIVHSPVRFSDLTAEEKVRYQEGARQLETYHQTALQIQSIAELQGIKVIFALQPELILSHKPLTDSEKRLAEYHRNVSGNYVTYAYEQYEPEIERRLAADKRLSFLSLLDVFDGFNGQMFTDYCHLTPAGNSRVADRIFEFAESSFRESAR
jgi:lysophospholipase L1-like esterase